MASCRSGEAENRFVPGKKQRGKRGHPLGRRVKRQNVFVPNFFLIEFLLTAKSEGRVRFRHFVRVIPNRFPALKGNRWDECWNRLNHSDYLKIKLAA